MTDHTTPWPAGAPAWTDLSVTDVARSTQFYTAVFGWVFEGGDEEFGGYLNATSGGRLVAGMAPPMDGMPEPPHVWTTYLAVTDSAATQRAVTAAGGRTVLDPMQVGPFGTMALYADPTGAGFGTWQPGDHGGFGRTGEHGSPSWFEAMVGDFAAGKAFYAAAFGWTYSDDLPGDMRYAMFGTAGEEPPMSGGIGEVEAGTAPYWAVSFEVDDVDAAADRVRGHGGAITTEPFDFEFGRLALTTGPDGEAFGLVASTPMESSTAP
ncbi:VOC family protein [Pseudactinotalea sp. HY160]|uniref:VOC family protein n=1 Tax=Pseudactinotalea sp. HY160 TaxID=2654490 RepID=UPI00128CD227|nr:VOC family protein [Pseudactinotalea sp. HY160]MPV49140.1 VOC family protein [Pseudactinotalea sp. HY160]